LDLPTRGAHGPAGMSVAPLRLREKTPALLNQSLGFSNLHLCLVAAGARKRDDTPRRSDGGVTLRDIWQMHVEHGGSSASTLTVRKHDATRHFQSQIGYLAESSPSSRVDLIPAGRSVDSRAPPPVPSWPALCRPSPAVLGTLAERASFIRSETGYDPIASPSFVPSDFRIGSPGVPIEHAAAHPFAS
jgi:hypothetical protein